MINDFDVKSYKMPFMKDIVFYRYITTILGKLVKLNSK